jgi:hypothetical protein
MHVLQWIAVKTKDTFEEEFADTCKEEAFDDVKLKFEEMYSESEGLGGWSDWYVVGGGRYNSNPDNQYEEKNAWNDVISYAETPDKFIETINRCIESRKIEFAGYRQNYEKQNIDISAKLDSYNGITDYSFDLYELNKMIDMLQGKWDMNSYFYDLNNWSTNPKWVLDSLDDSWYIVPVDFHF